MPFGYGTRTQHYIDVSDARPRDRIKVTLENTQVVTLMITELGQRGDLFVDEQRTDGGVLLDCYQHAVTEARQYSRRLERRKYTLESAKEQIKISLSVRSDKETFDNSPRKGEHLSLWCLFPKGSGTARRVPSPIKSVEFYTI